MVDSFIWYKFEFVCVQAGKRRGAFSTCQRVRVHNGQGWCACYKQCCLLQDASHLKCDLSPNCCIAIFRCSMFSKKLLEESMEPRLSITNLVSQYISVASRKRYADLYSQQCFCCLCKRKNHCSIYFSLVSFVLLYVSQPLCVCVCV